MKIILLLSAFFLLLFTAYAQNKNQDRPYFEFMPYILTGNATSGNETQDLNQEFSFSFAANVPLTKIVSLKAFLGNETSSYAIADNSIKLSAWRVGAIIRVFLD